MNNFTSIEYAVNHFSPFMCKLRKFNHSQMMSAILDSAIDGDIAEFGSYTGEGSAMVIAAVMHQYKTNKTLHLYDSFQGLSKLHPIDLQAENKEVYEGMFQCSQEVLLNNLSIYDINKKIHPGWVNETLPSQLPQQICYAHIDCDLYEPISLILKEIYQRLVPGAICVIDDYHFDTFPGATIAVDEFLADKSEYCQLLPNTIHCYFTKK